MPLWARLTTSSRLHLVGHGQVALATERDRLEGDLLLVSMLLAGPQPQRAQAEGGHKKERSGRDGEAERPLLRPLNEGGFALAAPA